MDTIDLERYLPESAAEYHASPTARLECFVACERVTAVCRHGVRACRDMTDDAEIA